MHVYIFTFTYNRYTNYQYKLNMNNYDESSTPAPQACEPLSPTVLTWYMATV